MKRIFSEIGHMTDSAATGVVGTAKSMMSYIKQLVNRAGAVVASATVVSSGIPNNTQTGGTFMTATGDVIIDDITFNTNGTGLAAPTNIEISTNNALGANSAAKPIFVEVIASFGANLTVSKKDATSHKLPILLESGKSLFIHGDDAAGTGAGTAEITVIGRAATVGAYLTGTDIAGS